MPLELPKKLPPRRQTDHQIDLDHQLELIEFQKQLMELLDAGLIQPSKASYGTLVLFQTK